MVDTVAIFPFLSDFCDIFVVVRRAWPLSSGEFRVETTSFQNQEALTQLQNWPCLSIVSLTSPEPPASFSERHGVQSQLHCYFCEQFPATLYAVHRCTSTYSNVRSRKPTRSKRLRLTPPPDLQI